MSRYDLPAPLCRHRPTVRVSSHLDLLAACDLDEPIASTYCCSRPGCLEDAKEWLLATTRRDAVHIVPLQSEAS